jgi:hypothetical protein
LIPIHLTVGHVSVSKCDESGTGRDESGNPGTNPRCPGTKRRQKRQDVFAAGLVELEFARKPVPLVLTSGVRLITSPG